MREKLIRALRVARAAWKFREVLDCGSPLPLFLRMADDVKRQRAAAVQDAGARFGRANPFGEHFCPCVAGGFWKDWLMAGAMADRVRQFAPKLFHGHECDRLSLIGISPNRIGPIQC